jgi:hypothetical protein
MGFQCLLSFHPQKIDPPQVTLSLGSTLNPDDIKEGDDVYFECHIKANPKEHRITWSRDVSCRKLFHIIYDL